MSSGSAPSSVASEPRTLAAGPKNSASPTKCGNCLARIDNCTASSATVGIAALNAKFRYVTPSIGCHASRNWIDSAVGFLVFTSSLFLTNLEHCFLHADAHPKVVCRIVLRRDESRFAEIEFASNLLHALGRNAGRVRQNRQLITAERCRTENIDDVKCLLHEIPSVRCLKP